MRHHTKDKGDLAVGEVIADLLRAGAQVCLPISEHLPFDLIAVSPSMKEVRRVQVRYVAARRGALRVPLRRTHADRHGVHHRPVKLEEFDCFAVYCPDTNRVYYVLSDEIRGFRTQFSLRVAPSRNGQTENTKPSAGFVGADRVFGARSSIG